MRALSDDVWSLKGGHHSLVFIHMGCRRYWRQHLRRRPANSKLWFHAGPDHRQPPGHFLAVLCWSRTPQLKCRPQIVRSDTLCLQDVGATFGDRLKIVKIDVDKYQNLASKHRIQGLPTLMLFKQGKPVDRIEGFLPASDLIMRIGKQV